MEAQSLITKSFYAKLLAVFRVSANKGKNTAGVDKTIRIDGYDKLIAAENLKTRGYTSKPLRRIYIPKKNGKKRPLSIIVQRHLSLPHSFAILLPQ